MTRSGLALAGILALAAGCRPSPTHDLVLRGGTLVDGSGAPGFVGDLAIDGDRIAALGDLGAATGRREIDVAGRVVAPGFINMLSWANTSLIQDGRSLSDIHQGVTLEVMGEGRSMGPWNEAMKREDLERQQDIRYPIAWTTLGEYLQHLEDRGVSTNVASFVGATTVRIHEVGYEDRPATVEELERMRQLVRRAMEEGAMGVGSSLPYAPAAFAPTDELVALATVAAEHGGAYVSHIRNEGDEIFAALDEFFDVLRRSGARGEIYHLKVSHKRNWPRLGEVVARIEAARAEGLAVTADIYPYHASSTGLTYILPAWVKEGPHADMIARLRNPAVRRRLLDEIDMIPPEDILLVSFRNEALRPLTGRTLAEVAAERGVDPKIAAMDLIVEDDSRIGTVRFTMSEDNVRRKMILPWVAFCSDAASMAPEEPFTRSQPHPRAYGSFARVLGRYVRDEGLLPLEQAVHRMTGLPAATLALDRRGLLRPGHYADVVVFDPATVADRATFEEPHRLAVGVDHVFVNGEHVVAGGAHTGAKPGRFVKGPGARGAGSRTVR